MNASIEGSKTSPKAKEFAHGPLDGELKFLWKEGGSSG
jgi:hypothetical protein